MKIKILIVFLIVTGLILTLFSVNAEDQAAVISKGKTATMHNSEGTEIAPVNDSFKIKYLTDGLYTSTAGTVWQTAVSGKYDVIFEIDLESLFEITGVTLTQRGNTCYPIDFTIDVWDGMNWTAAKSVTDNKPTDPDINVTDKDVTTAWKTELNMAGYELKTGSKVRIHATKISSHGKTTNLSALQLYEMEVYGVPKSEQKTNISYGKKATMYDSIGTTLASMNDAAAYVISNITDGKYTTQAATKWQTAVGGKHDVIFEIDLADWYKISEVTLVQRGNICYPIDFTIEIWDGNNWVAVKSVTGNKPSDPAIDVTDKEISTKWSTVISIDSNLNIGTKVRLHATNLAGHGNVTTSKALFLYEMEVYGTEREEPTNPSTSDNLNILYTAIICIILFTVSVKHNKETA